ncbi:hypothetical protein DY000_02052533 [Brassica cretica]|uniref:Uncharacterized protein n=1 Tax=Brassica cretica TaxID=69181 RepID=A0ABQ7A646_BRACR|nr:hypothetical protein DY000_02052533 [Brassica cretica]
MHDQSSQHDSDQWCYSQIHTLTHSKNDFTYCILDTSDLSETLFIIFELLLELGKNHLVRSLGYCSESRFNKNIEQVTFRCRPSFQCLNDIFIFPDYQTVFYSDPFHLLLSKGPSY